MAEVFLLSPHHPQKLVQLVKKQLRENGFDCEVLKTPIEALLKVKQCFGIKHKRLPNLKSSSVGPFRLSPSNYSIVLHGKLIKLTKKQYALLQFFIVNRNSILSRNTILENIWGPKVNPFSNTVDVHIAALKKIINTKKQHLKTVYGAGYILEI